MLDSGNGAVYWTTALVAFLTGGILAVLLGFRRRHRVKKLPFPPGPKAWPLIGNVLDIVAPEPWLLYMKWEQEHQSKILSVALPGGKRLVVLNAVDDAVALLEKKAGSYSDRPKIPLIEMAGWAFNTGLMSNNERWRHERRIFQQNFKREAVVRYQPIQTTRIHAMLRQLLTDPGGFAEHFKTLAAAIILEIMYGYEVKAKDDHIVQVVERAVAQLIENGANPSVAALNVFPILRYLPRWFPGTSFHKVVDDCRVFTKDMLDIPLEYVRKSMREGSAKPSLVRSLLESKAIGDDSVKGMAGTAFSAGTDTVLSVVECFFFAMALHPAKQRQAQEEIDRVIGLDRLPTWNDRDSLPCLEAIFRETHRWLPPFPLTVPHVAEEDDVYKGYLIPKGCVIYPNVWAMTHDKAEYDDPDTFIPERFLRTSGNPRNHATRILAFGFGRRLCPGQHLASNTVWLTMATVLSSFHIGLPYDLETGEPIQFQQVYTKADSLHMKPYRCSITPRSETARKLIEATEDVVGY